MRSRSMIFLQLCTELTFESRLLRTQVVKMVLLLSLMRSERCSTKYLARGADTASRSSLALKRICLCQ